MGRIFFDIDNTLTKTRQAMDTFERIYENNFFSRLSPYANMVDAANRLIDERKTDVFFVTSLLSDSNIYAQKRDWIKKYCPQASLTNIITYPPEMDLTAYIPLGVLPGDVLVDDYNRNLANWSRKNGIAVKFEGDLAGVSLPNNQSWEGFTVTQTDHAPTVAKGLQALSDCNGIDFKGTEKMPVSEVVDLRSKYVASPKIQTWSNRKDLTNLSKALVVSWLFYDDCEKSADIKQLLSACKMIHTYEATVKRVPALCYVDKLGRRKPGISQDAVLNYTEKCKQYLLFKEAVENAEEGTVLYVGEPSRVLKSLGCADPLYYTQRHLSAALQEDGKHPVHEVVMFKMPELIENSVAIWKAKTVDGKERIMLLLPEITGDGEAYVAVLEPYGKAVINGTATPSTFITSFYARGQAYSDLRAAAQSKNLMWYDVARLDKLLDSMGYRRPRDINRMMSGRIISKVSKPDLTPSELNKHRAAKAQVKPTTEKVTAAHPDVKRGAKKI